MTIGVNVSGAEYSWMPFVGASDLDYLASEGVTLIRLPISWERMQPTLNGALDPTYLSGLENVLSEAAARGIQVVVDLHNYGRYNLNYAADAAANYGITAPNTADASVIGSAAVPVSAFANFWSMLAGQLSGHAGLSGYDIMNEPYDMGSTTIWPQAAQAAVDAIRTVDKSTPIYVEGYQWASAANWLYNNANLHISDPANKIIYEAHQYFDSTGGGFYSQTYAEQGATPNTGVQGITPFLQWLNANNYQGFLGEFGVPGNDPQWTPVLTNVIDTLQAAGVSGTYWNYVYADPSGKNSWWPVADSMSINPAMRWGGGTMETIFSYSAPTITGFSPNTDVVGGITNTNHVTLTGTAAANSTVQVFDDGTKLGTVKANADGSWSFATGTLTNSVHAFTVNDIDGSGTVSRASPVLSVTVSTANTPTVASFSPDSNVVGDGITNANHVILTGSATANSIVQIYDGKTLLGTTIASATGSWSLATANLTDGAHSFTSKAVDTAGNISPASTALQVTVDTAAPIAPKVVSFSPDSNVIGDGITSANHVTLTGSAEASSVVQVYDGKTLLGTTVASATGTWSYATATLTDGTHNFTSKALDAAGNLSSASAVLRVTIDTVAPVAPKVAGFSPDSNVVGDGITNANHVTLSGSAVAGSLVQIYDGKALIGTTVTNTSGTWSYTTATLTDGIHSFTSKAVDAAGNLSSASAALQVSVDTVAPLAPVIVSDTVVSSNKVMLSGTAETGSHVTIFEGTTPLGSAVADSSGDWSYTTGPLSSGAHGFTASATDAAGNTSLMSPVFDPVIGDSKLSDISLVHVGADSKSGLVLLNDVGQDTPSWQTDGLQAISSQQVGTIDVTAGWHYAGSADFNGDGTADLLMLNTATNHVGILQTNGTEVYSNMDVGAINATGGWQYGGTGDFNGDGKSDLLFLNTATHGVAIWEMDGSKILASPQIGTINTAAGWQYEGTGDFNGDGKSDLLFLNTQTHGVAIWEMDGTKVLASPQIGTANAVAGWQYEGTADFNGDGKSDLLFLNTQTHGVAIWEMDGTKVLASPQIGTVNAASGWQYQSTGDFNGDGKSDLLFVNDVTHGVAVWELDGTHILSTSQIGTLAAGVDWHVLV